MNTSTRAATAEERLALSREKLRLRLSHYQAHNRAVKTSPASAPPDDHNWLVTLLESLSDAPTAVAARWLRRWWSNHPWRSTLDLAGAVSHELAAPLAVRHPWLLLGGAVLAGAAVSRLRPWRWISGGALLAGLLPVIHPRSVVEWVSATLATLASTRRPKAAAAAKAKAATTPPHTAAVAEPPPVHH